MQPPMIYAHDVML